MGKGGGKWMFRGIASVSVDAKGRVTVPAPQRTLINSISDDELVVTIDTEDRCLLLYPVPYWQEIEERLAQLPSFNPDTRRIQRLLIGHATDLSMDRHGRILLPPLLREYAGLDKNIIFVGQGKKIEIWGESQWELGRDSWLAVDMEENGVPPELLSLSL